MEFLTVEQVLELPSVKMEHKRLLSQALGIYFVVKEESEIIYIGKTHNYLERWAAHKIIKELPRGAFLEIYCLDCANEDLLSYLEEHLIRHFQPKLNSTKRRNITTELHYSECPEEYMPRHLLREALGVSEDLLIFYCRCLKIDIKTKYFNVSEIEKITEKACKHKSRSRN